MSGWIDDESNNPLIPKDISVLCYSHISRHVFLLRFRWVVMSVLRADLCRKELNRVLTAGTGQIPADMAAVCTTLRR